MNYIDKITLDDLEGEQKELAELLGLEKYIELVKTYGGTSLYILKADTVAKNIRDEAIRNEFRGDYKSLALKYGISVSLVREIINKKYKDISQISLF